MAEQNDSNQTEQEYPQERVGEILHKERVTKRIAIDTIAKDLKLNVKYIKAIESNDYDKLPADPYIRVYLRSIAEYLTLDPDEILSKFFSDKGIEDPRKNTDPGKEHFNIYNKTQNKSLLWIIISGVLIILLVTYMTNKTGFISNLSSKISSTSIEKDTTDNIKSEADDSLTNAEDSLNEESSKDTLQEKKKNKILTEKKKISLNDSLKLIIEAKKDSVWIQVFLDGKSWKNYIRYKEPKVFSAKDSINGRVGNNSLLKYTLNGEDLKVKGNGVTTFRIDHKGIKTWSSKKWRKTFKGRF